MIESAQDTQEESGARVGVRMLHLLWTRIGVGLLHSCSFLVSAQIPTPFAPRFDPWSVFHLFAVFAGAPLLPESA